MAGNLDLFRAKNDLETALGNEMKQYLELLKSWFKLKLSKEEFDFEARKLLTKETVHLHNAFLLSILDKIPYLGANINVKEDIQEARKKEKHHQAPSQLPTQFISSKDSKAFIAVNPLVSAPPSDPVPGEYQLEYMSESLLLPDYDVLQGRLLVTAWSAGLDDVTQEGVEMIFEALQVMLKNIISAVVSRRKGYRVRDGSFQSGYSNALPSCFLQNFSSMKSCFNENEMVNDYLKDYPATFPEVQQPDQQLKSSRRDYVPVPLVFKISLFDLYDTLKVNKSILPSHTIYSTTLEMISNSMWHPPNS